MENEVKEIVEEVKEPIFDLEYVQEIEETKKLIKYTVNVELNVFNAIILPSITFVIGVLALILKIEEVDALLKFLGWFLVIVSPLIILINTVARIYVLRAVKKIDNPSYINYKFCDDKIRYSERCGEQSASLIREYKDIKKVYIHEEWVLLRTDKVFSIVKANDKKDDIVKFVKTKNEKIKIIRK